MTSTLLSFAPSASGCLLLDGVSPRKHFDQFHMTSLDEWSMQRPTMRIDDEPLDMSWGETRDSGTPLEMLRSADRLGRSSNPGASARTTCSPQHHTLKLS